MKTENKKLTEKEVNRFMEIFLQNNPKYTGIIMILHTDEHDTTVGCVTKDQECRTMDGLVQLLHHVMT